MLPLCRDEGVGVIPWSPLGRGRLTRPWDETTNRSENDAFAQTLYTEAADRAVVERVSEVAAERGMTDLHWTFVIDGLVAHAKRRCPENNELPNYVARGLDISARWSELRMHGAT